MALGIGWPPVPAHARLLAQSLGVDAAWTVDFEEVGRIVLRDGAAHLDALAGGQAVQAAAVQSTLRLQGGGDWLLGANGRWSGTAGYLGAVGPTDPGQGLYTSLVIDFGGATVDALTARVNIDPGVEYVPGRSVPLLAIAYDLRGERLEAHELLPSTPGAVDAGVVVGFGRDRPDIARVEFSGPAIVLDDLQFAQPVPEPGVLLMALVGVALLLVGRLAAPRNRSDVD